MDADNINSCNLCPRECNIRRTSQNEATKNDDYNSGYCRMGSAPVVARASLHFWEEPCVSGTKGSGTIFFSGCNLRCVFCQNYKISHDNFGREISLDELKNIIFNLIKQGAHNINLVNPTHYVLAIKNALEKCGELPVPVIYNSNGYEKINSLNLLKDNVSVFMPDLKYMSPELSYKYSGATDYFKIASKAILKMYDMVDGLVLDNDGIIKKGLIIRHMILPGQFKDSMKILKWIKENMPDDIMVSIMCQYTPFGDLSQYPEINRRLTTYEYKKVINYAGELELLNGYIQHMDSSGTDYIPDFNLQGIEVSDI